MIRIVAALILAAVGLAQPARACGSGASSTFCADGWVAQQPAKALGPESGGDAQADGWPGDGAEPGGDGIYVEGAVVVDAPSPEDGGQL
ncbi:hypothetical protein [Paracoccus sp. S3-43]|uniref:hypothetical protein n=1 Tax=Paracoccus sp. S3-43 TaxID=3030011 RepID=UPI0023B1CB22|nr:hypothetical protein [Paracoccus sp. S3-43]WEF23396.1 hypothetical protein PXD02_11290 [Paracoccus sp. S3-43]